MNEFIKIDINTDLGDNFPEDDNWFEYSISIHNCCIAKGIHSIEEDIKYNAKDIENYVLQNIEIFISKPSIYKCGKLLQYIVLELMDSGNFCSRTYYEDIIENTFDEDEILAFIEDCNNLSLFEMCIVEYNNIEIKKDEFYIDCFGLMNTIFDVH